jgi:hypothetical protein
MGKWQWSSLGSRVRKQNLIVQPGFVCLPGHGVERFPALVIAVMLVVEQIPEIDAAVRANLMKGQVVGFEISTDAQASLPGYIGELQEDQRHPAFAWSAGRER